MPRPRPARWRWAGGALAVIVAAALLHVPALRAAARFMAVDTATGQADIVLIPHYQDPSTIPSAAAALLRRGHAPRIALPHVRPNRLQQIGILEPSHVVWQRLLIAQGVPSDRIVVVGRELMSRHELAQAVADSLGRERRGRVIAVVPRPLSRTRRIDLTRAFAGMPIDLQIHAVPRTGLDERHWWRSRDGIITYVDAYVLWGLRLLR